MERNSEWERVERTPAFKELTRTRKAFVLPATIFFFVFYFGLVFLASYTTFLNGEVVGAITWIYIYAFAQFAMTWILMHVYLSRANRWDDLVDEARQQAARGEGENS